MSQRLPRRSYGESCGGWKAFTSDGKPPMGDYVVDFVCHRSRLIVEVDGGVHDWDVVAQRDAARDRWLAGRGYLVLRLTNREVLAGVEAAVARIITAAGSSTPTPDPSPQGGGEIG
jgi:very-short-patch-repair endonuclease